MTWDPFLESPAGNLAMPGWRPYPKIRSLRELSHANPLLKHPIKPKTWLCNHVNIANIRRAFPGTVNTGTLPGPLVVIKPARTWRLEQMWPSNLLTPIRACLGRGRPEYDEKSPNVNSNCTDTGPTILHNRVTQKISQTK